MDIFTLLREAGENWMLVGMFTFYIGVIIFAFLPGLSKAREDASMIVMRNDYIPADDETSETTCSGKCATCACSTDLSATRGLSNG